jgi:hypothetical protein
MKFTELTAYKEFDRFQPIRNIVALYGLYNILTILKPKKILEIGYYEGHTFSLIYECLENHADYFTSCDITYSENKVKEFPFLKCEFNEMSSQEFSPNKFYDFISLDGQHNWHKSMLDKSLPSEIVSCESLVADFKKFYQALEVNGIIMIDGSAFCNGIKQLVIDILPDYPAYRPIIVSEYQLFIGPVDFNYTNILENLSSISNLLLSWKVITYCGYKNVLSFSDKIKDLSTVFPRAIKQLEHIK